MTKVNNAKAILMVIVILSIIAFMASQTMAADILIEGKITSVTQKISKNGNPYVIFVVPENKELNGIKYLTETSVFCFNHLSSAKLLKAGDPVKLIAKRTSKDGNEFTTLVQFLK